MNNERHNSLQSYNRKIVNELKRSDNVPQMKAERLSDNLTSIRNLRDNTNIDFKPFIFQTTNGTGNHNPHNSNVISFLNFNEMDDTFCKLIKKIQIHDPEFDREKFKVLRSLNFTFKKNSALSNVSKLHIKQFECLKSKNNFTNSGQALGYHFDPSSPDVTNKILFEVSTKNNNEIISNKKNHVDITNSSSTFINSNENSFLNKKRLAAPDINSNPKINISENDKYPTDTIIIEKLLSIDDFFNTKQSAEVPNNERLENSKKVFEKSNLIISGSNRSDIKDPTEIQQNACDNFILSSVNSNSNLNYLNNKSIPVNDNNNKPNENSSNGSVSINQPILAKSYPDNPSNKIQVNMNITNININQKNAPNLKNMRTSSKCDHDAKLISDLKCILRKTGVGFREEHSYASYIFNFKIPFENSFKVYELAVDNETSKILNYKKARDKNIIIAINNTEDSAATLIYNELGNVKNEIEKGLNIKINI